MRNLEKWRPYREQSGPSECWGVRTEPTPGDADSGKVNIIIKATAKLDGPDCQMICATHNAHLKAYLGERTLWAESIVNQRLEPRVQLTIGEISIQMDIREARGHVSNLQEAIEAGLSDAMLARFLRDVVFAGSPEEVPHMIGNLMQEFRNFREQFIHPTAEESDHEA